MTRTNWSCFNLKISMSFWGWEYYIFISFISKLLIYFRRAILIILVLFILRFIINMLVIQLIVMVYSINKTSYHFF